MRRWMAVLVSAALFLTLVACGDKAVESSSDTVSTTSSNNYANLKENPRAKVEGTFIQSWLCSSWSDERWAKELTNLKDLGMEYIIMGDSAVKNKSGNWYSFYPSKLEGVKEGYGGKDVIGNALRNCQKFGFKVFVGMGLDEQWWDKFASDPDWLYSAMEQSNQITSELYDMYYEQYKDAFYGWYWVPEIWNNPTLAQSSAKRENEIQVLSKAMSINLDHLTQMNPAMPMMLSPFVNIEMGSAKDNFAFWRDLLNTAHFREGDILCPMDAIGAGGCKMEFLDIWTKSYRQAVDENGKVKLWSNNEDFYTYNITDNKATSRNVDHFVRQIQITSKYCEKIVTFAYSHYYSPYNSLPGFNETYRQYVETGEVEKQAPSAPTNFQVKLQGDVALMTWDPSTDNIGIAGYVVYRDGEICERVYSERGDNGPIPPLPTEASDWDAQKTLDKNGKADYEVEAFDFAGNTSEKASITITK